MLKILKQIVLIPWKRFEPEQSIFVPCLDRRAHSQDILEEAERLGIEAGDHITVDYNVEGKDNIADLVVVEKGEAAPPQGSAKEKPAETSGENVNMTAAPEASNPVTPQTAAPLAVANQTAAVNATETPAAQ